MSLDLERQLTFYGAYHHNPVNIGIHMICVPLILFSSFWMASNSPTLIPLPQWLSVHYLALNAGTIASLVWGGLYVLLEPFAGTILAVICLGMAGAGNYMLESYDTFTVTAWAGAVFTISWILQFVGHGKFEGRAPALLDNLVQAIFLAPLFVWLALLFYFGYRPELQARVEKAVQKELAKYKSQQMEKNGKAQ